MKCYVGIDIGAVSLKAALLAEPAQPLALAPEQFQQIGGYQGYSLFVSSYRRTRGQPIHSATELLEQLIAAIGADAIAGICFTGGAGHLAAQKLGCTIVNEFKAIATGLWAVGVKARTVFEMGGQSSKYLLLEEMGTTGVSPVCACEGEGTSGMEMTGGAPVAQAETEQATSYSIIDYSTNGDCAAGTGSFIDQQAGRLRYAVQDVGQIALEAQRWAQVAGRCSVFAKSDMIHAQQKGYSPAEVLAGLCNAVARNFRMAVVRSHAVHPPVAFIGGLAANAAVVRGMREAFELDERQFFVPAQYAHMPAIGAAVTARNDSLRIRATASYDFGQHFAALRKASDSSGGAFPTAPPLSMERVTLLRDRAVPVHLSPGRRTDAYLGIDIGSVSTNLVLIDNDGQVIKEIYVRTMGRPIEVVSKGLADIAQELGDRIAIRGVGTTGSGRELIGELVGADTVNDEITAHKTGATFLGQTMLAGRVPDTIFEIGGQDSKYISLQDGIVVDFMMNEACAAGTGSFLEERAEELDIPIIDEFARLALSSRSPIRLGERCTVFMERDVNDYLQRGASKADLVAGLAYSVVYNYINRVVRGRQIGQCIFFQGGTAYNDAVAAAFAEVLGKEIIVPPYNGVIGAIGSALLAREKMLSTQLVGGAGIRSLDSAAQRQVLPTGQYVSDHVRKEPTASEETLQTASEDTRETASGGFSGHRPLSRFRGYDMSKVKYKLREFTCNGCSNHCIMQEFDVEGEKTYWGDKCSEKYRKRRKSAAKPAIEDLFAYREGLFEDASKLPAVDAGAPTVGIPLAMFALDHLPFWRAFWTRCGFRVVASKPTSRQAIATGMANVVAEPCFPVIVAHGHLAELIEQGVDWLFVPNTVSAETAWLEAESYLCPWNQTLPFVLRRVPAFEPHADKFLCPCVEFRLGRQFVTRAMAKFCQKLGLPGQRVESAMTAAYQAQQEFRTRLAAAGQRALEHLTAGGQSGIVIIGRPYNIHDASVNLNVARKLRDYYGVNCIPIDAIDVAELDIRDVNDNMFWDYGRRMLAAAKLVGRHENLHIIHITNFKCGPDSFVKHFLRRASGGKPLLSLQFDGHSNDAGMMTRCEAYLDSKGILRPWKKVPVQEAVAAK